MSVRFTIAGAADLDTIAVLREYLGASAEIVVEGEPPAVAAILDAVAYEMGVPKAEIVAPIRGVRVFRARCATTWLARHLSHRSYNQIARVIGGFDHASIMHQFDRAKEMRLKDPAFRAVTDKLAARFTGENA